MKENKKPKSLQEKLEEKKKQLVAISKDAHFAKSLIEDLLSLQSQKCIEPTELHVPVSDVIDTLDFDAVSFKVCKTGLLFHAKSGYTVWIEPRCRALFGELFEILKAKKELLEKSPEEIKEMDEEEVDMREQYFSAWVHTLQMPVAASISPVILFKTAAAFLATFNEESERMLNQPLKEETVEDLIANDDAQKQEAVLDAMAEQLNE